VIDDLKEAYKALAALGAKYSVWQVTVEPGTEEAHFRNAIETFVRSRDLRNIAPDVARRMARGVRS
jgi:hypothetical protein